MNVTLARLSILPEIDLKDTKIIFCNSKEEKRIVKKSICK